MSQALEVRDEQRWFKTWRCSDCGDFFELSYRASTELKRTKRLPVCQRCRFPVAVVVTEGLLDWWRQRFTEDEIVYLAEALWGPRYLWNL